MNTELYNLNIKFYEVLEDIFKIKKCNTWEDLAKRIKLEKIAETYKSYSEIFNQNLNWYDLIPKNPPDNKLTSIFHGTLDGLTIINNIARYSLYVDEIIVFHPLQNPIITSSEYDPIKKPHLYRRDFVNALYFYIVLQKWVRAGIVHLIENPFRYDSRADVILKRQANQRVSRQEEFLNTPEIKRELVEMMQDKFIKSFVGMPVEAIESTLRSTASFKRYSEEKITALAIEMKNYEKGLPLYVDFGKEVPAEQISMTKSGGNIEEINAICQLTGANTYTTQKYIRKQLELIGENPFWTKFGSLYSGVNLKYLDKVDTAYALKLREEERLSGLRTILRDLSSFLDNSDLKDIKEERVLEFTDKFKFAIERAEIEWKGIIDDARKKNMYAIAGTSVIGLLLDPTKIIVPAIGVPSSVAITEYFKKRKIERYRQKDPISVFVDLKNEKPSFYSELKNCVF